MFPYYSRTIHTLALYILCLRTAFAFKVPLPLPSKHLCLQRSFTVIEGPLPLPSKGRCRRRAIAVEGHLPSKGLWHRRALPSMCPWLYHRRALPSKCLCNRWDFTIERPVASKCPWLCHRSAFAIEGPLPSRCPCLCHRRAYTFKVALPLPSMGRRLQSTLAFGIEGPLPSNALCFQRALEWHLFAFKGPLLSKGLRH